MRRPIGIKEVAIAAGVSTTTVSHALNGKGRLPDTTRARVRAVAEQARLPAERARGVLAGGRTAMLAMTVSGSDEFAVQVGDLDYFLQVTNAATSAALERGYAVTLLPARWRPETLARLPLDGGIVVDPVRDDAVVAALNARALPVVTLGRQPDGPADAPWIDNDHHAGTARCSTTSRARGPADRPPLGAHGLLLRAGHARRLRRVVRGHRGRAAGRDSSREPERARRLRRDDEAARVPHPPDGIYATLDRLALGALLAADARGVRVPADLRIAACTESHAARSSPPGPHRPEPQSRNDRDRSRRSARHAREDGGTDGSPPDCAVLLDPASLDADRWEVAFTAGPACAWRVGAVVAWSAGTERGIDLTLPRRPSRSPFPPAPGRGQHPNTPAGACSGSVVPTKRDPEARGNRSHAAAPRCAWIHNRRAVGDYPVRYIRTIVRHGPSPRHRTSRRDS